ncbi:MAG: hypothetical protein ACK4RK_03065 [Gemmataceae bacterium]
MFQIDWTQSALDELTVLWLTGDSQLRQLITEATHLIDQELQANPHEQGESRGGEERIFFVYPLGVQFIILHQPPSVRVLHVWDIRRNK